MRQVNNREAVGGLVDADIDAVVALKVVAFPEAFAHACWAKVTGDVHSGDDGERTGSEKGEEVLVHVESRAC